MRGDGQIFQKLLSPRRSRSSRRVRILLLRLNFVLFLSFVVNVFSFWLRLCRVRHFVVLKFVLCEGFVCKYLL
jgi:uncharacterized membrane protein